MDKVVLTRSDLMEMHCIKETTASAMIRNIKSCSDILHLRGVVHVKDYEAWIKAREEAEKKRRES